MTWPFRRPAPPPPVWLRARDLPPQREPDPWVFGPGDGRDWYAPAWQPGEHSSQTDD